jgi:hypothetical protein
MASRRIWLAANAIVTIAQSISSAKGSNGERTVMTLTGQRDSKPVLSQEDRLFDLLRKAEGYAYAPAHSYDIGNHTERAEANLPSPGTSVRGRFALGRPRSSLWARGPWGADTRYGYGPERSSASR